MPPPQPIVTRRSRYLPMGFLLLVSATLMLPIWLYGFPTNGDDAHVHIRWQTQFAQQLWAGELYPRWLAGMNDGLGSPAFFIYPPLPHFVAAVLAPFSEGPLWVQQRLGIAATLGLFIGALGAYLWLYRLTGTRASALVGALVFLLAPYHLFLDTYYRAAYAELWAFSWAPFSLLAIHLFDRSPARGVLVGALAMAALLLSHAPSCIALPPLYIAYAALLAIRTGRLPILWWTCAAMGCGVLLAGIYLTTALGHQRNIDVMALYTGYFDFFRWFLLSRQEWPEQDFEMAIGGASLPQYVALLVLGGLTLASRRITPVGRTLVLAAIVGSLLILFLMSPLSAPVWSAIPLARKIQFPWRLLTAQTVLLALVCALYAQSALAARAQGSRALQQRLLAPLLAALVLANGVAIYHAQPLFGDTGPLGTLDVPEYQMGPVPDNAARFAAGASFYRLSGQGAVRLETISARHLRVHVQSTTAVRIALRQFDYPGWQCTSTGSLAGCSLQALGTQAPLMVLTSGAGAGHIDVVLGQTAAETTGRWVSSLGLLMLAGLVCLGLRVGRGKRTALDTEVPVKPVPHRNRPPAATEAASSER